MDHDSNKTTSHCCHKKQTKTDLFFWGCLFLVVALYLTASLNLPYLSDLTWLRITAFTTYELLNRMWLGILLGIVMVSLLATIPREFIMAALGTNTGVRGVIRATFAGVLLDLCSHGILMVAASLYERGASTGQMIAFLVASPWNSFSLTLILIALIGLPWTLLFILLSMVIAIVTGLIFDALVKRSILPANPHRSDLPDDFMFWQEACSRMKSMELSPNFVGDSLKNGWQNSRMVLRWILFGILLASIIRASLSPEHFVQYFGATIAGLGLTVLVATLVEVCSEGSTPIAAELVNKARAPGNGFAFLMAGVATDYTEIMVLKSRTRSLKLALFLPLISLPQVLFVAWLINLGA